MTDYSIEKLANYENILVTDEKGYTLFYDVPDLNVLHQLGQRPEDFLGKRVTSFYKDLAEKDSTVMTVLRTQKPLIDFHQVMTTRNGNKIESISSTYPLIEDGNVRGAIEFSKRFYSNKNIEALTNYAAHKIYRKNNTVYTLDDLVTKSAGMEKVKEKIRKVSRTDSTLMITGETGTGKEIVAQSIHNLSERYTGPFISLNCSAVPENLIEGTLFGTVKGSFTGAEDSPGLFEQANGGTLFLDEINSLDITLQVKLLKAIEEKVIRRVGGSKNIPVDIRVMSATNENLETLLAERQLRMDLYYRIAVVTIDLPPLRERKKDIHVLLDYYLDFFNDKMNLSITDVEEGVRDRFMNYDWPGNVRELKNAIEMAYNETVDETLRMEDIPERITTGDMSGVPKPPLQDTSISLKKEVETYEKRLISEYFNASDGSLTETSKRLGISKQSLKYKMEKYGI